MYRKTLHFAKDNKQFENILIATDSGPFDRVVCGTNQSKPQAVQTINQFDHEYVTPYRTAATLDAFLDLIPKLNANRSLPDGLNDFPCPFSMPNLEPSVKSSELIEITDNTKTSKEKRVNKQIDKSSKEEPIETEIIIDGTQHNRMYRRRYKRFSQRQTFNLNNLTNMPRFLTLKNCLESHIEPLPSDVPKEISYLPVMLKLLKMEDGLPDKSFYDSNVPFNDTYLFRVKLQDLFLKHNSILENSDLALNFHQLGYVINYAKDLSVKPEKTEFDKELQLLLESYLRTNFTADSLLKASESYAKEKRKASQSKKKICFKPIPLIDIQTIPT